tara:strand:+ start:190 stop:369 length:180 start_codon:yes stop_codon:yes gene_type:complete
MRIWQYFNQGSLSRNLMPEEAMPELDETFYPDTSDLMELLAAMSVRHESHNTHKNNNGK